MELVTDLITLCYVIILSWELLSLTQGLIYSYISTFLKELLNKN